MAHLSDEFYMQRALELAEKATLVKEVPVGAVIVKDDQILAEAFNLKETRGLATAHAEILAIELASAKLGGWRLEGCELFVTLEPCLMCCGAIIQSRLSRVVFGARDAKGGAVVSLYQTLSDSRLNHRPIVRGEVLSETCGYILSKFFNQLRSKEKSKS